MKRGHPLDGKELHIDDRLAPRRDGRIHVRLPDGSPALLPLQWTSLGAPGAPERSVKLRREDLHWLREFVDELKARDRRPR